MKDTKQRERERVGERERERKRERERERPRDDLVNSKAMGVPTSLLRPTTTARLPERRDGEDQTGLQ